MLVSSSSSLKVIIRVGDDVRKKEILHTFDSVLLTFEDSLVDDVCTLFFCFSLHRKRTKRYDCIRRRTKERNVSFISCSVGVVPVSNSGLAVRAGCLAGWK
jgi:hypothetical protein